MTDILDKQRQYLAQLLEAIQRSAYFLRRSQDKVNWPLQGATLAQQSKDVDLFETLAAINERFAKLQDSLAAVMRHTALLMGEDPGNFLKVLATFEKWGLLESSSRWQQGRVIRNMATHDYDLDYQAIADHFNALHDLTPMLLDTARNLLRHARQSLSLQPASATFTVEFEGLFNQGR